LPLARTASSMGAMAVSMTKQLMSVLPQLRFQPTSKRVRVRLVGVDIADTTCAMLIWEPMRTSAADRVAAEVDCPPARSDLDDRYVGARPHRGRPLMISGGDHNTIHCVATTSAGDYYRDIR
jgi:hypothetical protein